jgi:hypothetical protein
LLAYILALAKILLEIDACFANFIVDFFKLEALAFVLKALATLSRKIGTALIAFAMT